MARPETTSGNEANVGQENRGRDVEGGGEWPDPDAAPSGPSPGTTADGDAVAAQRDDVPTAGSPYDGVSAEQAAVGSLPVDDEDRVPDA